MYNSNKIKLFLLDNLIWVLVLLFFIINAIFTPKFASPTNLVNICYHATILALLVLGQGLILIVGQMDLSIESTMAFAPGIAVLLATQWLPGGMNPYICILVTLLVGALVGLFNGLLVSRVGVNPFLQTLSTNIMLRGLVLFLLPFSLFNIDPVYIFAGSGFVFGIQAAIPIVLVIFAIFQYVLKYTTFGRSFMATGGNAKASYISGINTKRILTIAFVLSGLLAGVAGLLAAGRAGSIANSMGDGMVMMSFAGAILGGASLSGGKGTPLGMLGGALLLQMISNSLTLLGVPINLVYAVKGGLIFLAILLDRYKIRLRSNILQQAQLKELMQKPATQDSAAQETPSSEDSSRE
ncbi:MAG: ABC transporter permease [Bacillota bacterium]|nr:ABC transporter permease [Bacillota bacterium]